jgi:hypothetical protein
MYMVLIYIVMMVIGRFARYRDHKEAVQQYPAVVASCVLLAYQEMSAQMDVDVKVRTCAALISSVVSPLPAHTCRAG